MLNMEPVSVITATLIFEFLEASRSDFVLQSHMSPLGQLVPSTVVGLYDSMQRRKKRVAAFGFLFAFRCVEMLCSVSTATSFGSSSCCLMRNTSPGTHNQPSSEGTPSGVFVTSV